MQSISDYLKKHHPQDRQPTMRKLHGKIQSLKDAPYIGRPGRVEGTPGDLIPTHALRRRVPRQRANH